MGLSDFNPTPRPAPARDPISGRFVSSEAAANSEDRSEISDVVGSPTPVSCSRQICSTPEPQFQDLPDSLESGRLFLLKTTSKIWANGTVIHFAFLDHSIPSRAQAVRDAFQTWKDVGIGLKFVETSDLSEAEIRISFEPTGSWSYIGRDAVDLVTNSSKATMNIGWEVVGEDADTAIHEVGHALGFPHEHQNGNTGIVWNVPAVLAAFSQPPNNWDENQIRHNILNKLHSQETEGSAWDSNSVMHYPFQAGLILSPPSARNGIFPAPGLSEEDKRQVKIFYPELEETNPDTVEPTPYQSLTELLAGVPVPFQMVPAQQLDFRIEPDATRKYSLMSFGPADVGMALFVWRGGDWRFHAGANNAGHDGNAKVQTRLIKGEFYVLRLRVLSAEHNGQGAVGLFRA